MLVYAGKYLFQLADFYSHDKVNTWIYSIVTFIWVLWIINKEKCRMETSLFYEFYEFYESVVDSILMADELNDWLWHFD